MSSRLAYTSRTGPDHAAVVARIHAATVRARPVVPLCRTSTPELHERGEFPMTCHACHMVADS